MLSHFVISPVILKILSVILLQWSSILQNYPVILEILLLILKNDWRGRVGQEAAHSSIGGTRLYHRHTRECAGGLILVVPSLMGRWLAGSGDGPTYSSPHVMNRCALYIYIWYIYTCYLSPRSSKQPSQPNQLIKPRLPTQPHIGQSPCTCL
jgi:hypothetical protein